MQKRLQNCKRSAYTYKKETQGATKFALTLLRKYIIRNDMYLKILVNILCYLTRYDFVQIFIFTAMRFITRVSFFPSRSKYDILNLK